MPSKRYNEFIAVYSHRLLMIVMGSFCLEKNCPIWHLYLNVTTKPAILRQVSSVHGRIAFNVLLSFLTICTTDINNGAPEAFPNQV